jgi:hypothetical protein
MDLILVVIAVVSALLALACGTALWHVLRAERERSEARVALLRAAAGVEAGGHDAGAAIERDADANGDRSMFAPAPGTAPPVNIAILGGTALAMAAAIVVVLQLLGTWTGSSAGTMAAAHRPLELLALDHTPHREGLRVSGVARNPAGSGRLAGVLVTVAALDADGTEIGGGRAAVDHAVLEPGTESPFVINVAVAGIVSRYRVGFRGPDGTVIAHVDRRAPDRPHRDSTLGGGPWVH